MLTLNRLSQLPAAGKKGFVEGTALHTSHQNHHIDLYHAQESGM